jgi:hypothetical protein
MKMTRLNAITTEIGGIKNTILRNKDSVSNISTIAKAEIAFKTNAKIPIKEIINIKFISLSFDCLKLLVCVKNLFFRTTHQDKIQVKL